MSRIGKKIIPFPKGVNVKIGDGSIDVQGPKGKLSSPIPAGITAKIDDDGLTFSRSGDDGPSRANHGLARALAANCVTGVSEGFKKQLQIIGVGYRASVSGKALELHLGYSHPINYPLPDGVSADVEQDRATKSIIVTIQGIDKQLVGQVAAEIRRMRKPEPYKGKGVRYLNEQILRKAGKAGK